MAGKHTDSDYYFRLELYQKDKLRTNQLRMHARLFLQPPARIWMRTDFGLRLEHRVRHFTSAIRGKPGMEYSIAACGNAINRTRISSKGE